MEGVLACEPGGGEQREDVFEWPQSSRRALSERDGFCWGGDRFVLLVVGNCGVVANVGLGVVDLPGSDVSLAHGEGAE